MSKLLYNAHAHLTEYKSQKLELPDSSVALTGFSDQNYTIVNGASPADWPAVLRLAQNPGILTAIGLHPQNVDTAPTGWKKTFLQLLQDNLKCFVGEVGLDRRYQNDHFKNQVDAFLWQFKIACKQNRPVSIHCVKAIGILMETLRNETLPSRGIHLHAYSGPVELISELVEKGAYFSFAATQLTSQSEKVQNRICAVPMNRLLIETDMSYEKNASKLLDCYTIIARMREVHLDALVARIEENFKRYFLDP